MSQLTRDNPGNPDFVFSISLKEIVNALHKYYLNVGTSKILVEQYNSFQISNQKTNNISATNLLIKI